MKLCTKCGAQLADEATFCAKCGTSLNAAPAPQNSAPQNPNPVNAAPMGYAPNGYAAPMGYAPYGYAPVRQKAYVDPVKARAKKLAIFNFVYAVSIALACFFTAFSFLFADIYSSGSISASYYSGYSVDVYTHMSFEEISPVFAGIFSATALGFGIVSFIFGLKEKDNPEKMFGGIARFAIGLIATVFSIIMLAEIYG